MKLVYYNNAVPNFGDDLNAAIWPSLAPALFAEATGEGFVGIGTIIGMASELDRLTVFSSGVGYDRTNRWANKTVRYACVRGPVSAEVLGLDQDSAITDGAVLVPLVGGFPAKATGGGGVIIIPHWETIAYPGWDEVARLTGFQVIDPRGNPLSVAQAIARASLVLTESLHGAVLADLYGLPWTAFATSRNFSVTKWVDWSMSLGRGFSLTLIPPPDPGPVLAHGRRPEAYGRRLTFSMDDALREMQARIGEPAPAPVGAAARLRARAKTLVGDSSLLRPLLGFNAQRTARALIALAQAPETPTSASIIETLQQRMMSRLDALSKEAAA
ncbi:MAG: polysaccharide pyruvyl transferase family protein [Caulobacteraceae bacterium]